MQNFLSKKNAQGNNKGGRSGDTDQSHSDQFNTLKVRGILEMDSKEIQNDNYYSKTADVQQHTIVREPKQQPLLHENNNLNLTDIDSVITDIRLREDEITYKKIIKRQEKGADSSSSSEEEEQDKLQKSANFNNEVGEQVTFFEQFVMMQVKGSYYV